MAPRLEDLETWEDTWPRLHGPASDSGSEIRRDLETWEDTWPRLHGPASDSGSEIRRDLETWGGSELGSIVKPLIMTSRPAAIQDSINQDGIWKQLKSQAGPTPPATSHSYKPK